MVAADVRRLKKFAENLEPTHIGCYKKI